MASLKPGELFDARYRIQSTIGEGGFAIVYAAVEESTGRHVALKVLKPADGPTTGADRARFEREARIAGQLRSSHVPRLFEFGEDANSQLFTASALVDGEDLSDVLNRDGRLDQEVAKDVLRQLLDALDEAHRAGLVHRDIKPENIRVSADPKRRGLLRATLLDFGIARATDDGHPSITRTGELIGTPRYMSPEQLTGRPLTPASDIYSLGVVVFEMLAGRDALQGGAWGDQLERLRDGHVFDSPVLDGVDATLVDVMRRMTRQSESDRFASIAAVVAALRLDAETVRFAPTASVRRAATPSAWLAAVVMVVVLAGGFASMVWGGEQSAAPARPPAPRALGGLVRSSTPTLPPTPASAVDMGPDVPDLGSAEVDFGASRCGQEPDFSSIPHEAVKHWTPINLDPSTKYPLVIALHGDLEGAGQFVHEAHFDVIGEAEQFAFVAPFDGTLPWQDFDRSRQLILRTVRMLNEAMCIDLDRVFLIGNREGAYAALPLSCEPWVRATAIAAIGVPEDLDILSCPTPAPTIWFQPSLAARAPKDGGLDCEGRRRLPLESVVKSFRQRGDCRGKPRVTISRDDGKCRASQCETAFELCNVRGGAFWPGQDKRAQSWSLVGLVGCPSGKAPTFPMLETAWRFFAAQPPRAVVDPSH